MGKVVDMSNFDPLFDNLEKYVNKQGCTLGKDAERLQKLLYSLPYCYILKTTLCCFCKTFTQIKTHRKWYNTKW